MSETAIRREWLSYAEAQELTHLGKTTLWAVISRGDVKAARVGRAVRINRASLEGYMERSAYTGHAEIG
jgi:excisionase family DNA binding protein